MPILILSMQILGGMSINIPLPLLLPLIILELILMIVALVDLIPRDPRRVQGSKLVWGLIIVFVATLGPICYLLVGRKEQADVYP